MWFTSRNHPACRQHLLSGLKAEIIFSDCIASQAQSMAALPTVAGDGGPVLGLTGEQCTEYALLDGCDLPGSSNCEETGTKHSDPVLYESLSSPFCNLLFPHRN